MRYKKLLSEKYNLLKLKTNNFRYSKIFILLSLFSIFTTILVWLPFIYRTGDAKSHRARFGFESIYRNYDGLMFVIPAKTNYRSDQIEKYKVLDLKPSYYAAHTPGYPVLIKLLAPIFGYMESMIFINLIGSAILACLLYLVYKNVFGALQPFWLTLATLIFPRLWILRSTGSSEIVFMICIFSALLLIKDKRFLLAGIFAGYASFTRIHGVLFGAGLSLYFLFSLLKSKSLDRNILFVSLGSIAGFLAVCLLYLRQYGDFFAYFNTNAVVPSGLFYSQFDSSAKEVKTFFLEDVLFYFAIFWVYIFDRIKKHRDHIFFFVLTYFAFTLTIVHRDIARYLIPVVPILMGQGHGFIEKPVVKWALIAISPAIYWYVVNFMSSNMFLDSMKPFM